MTVLAQHGHQPTDKITRGLKENVISGVIFSARCASPEKARTLISEARLVGADAEILLDPEFYATRLIGTPNCQLGNLEGWPYFRAQRRRDLVKTEAVERVLKSAREAVSGFDVSAHIAPNVYIPQSFDSMEAGIALNFIEQTKPIFAGSRKLVYATLAVDRRALLSPEDFRSFLNDLTGLENPPDGFYVLIGGGPLAERSDLAQSEVMDANVIGGWMLLNFILSLNGFRVVNGFTDVLTPFLAAAGGQACSTGWWSNLRVFSMGRYVKPESGGGQLPTIRYLSKLLLNHIKITERYDYGVLVPGIVNRLSYDGVYDNGSPGRTEEALQMWEALTSLTQEAVSGNVENDLAALRERVTQAGVAYTQLRSYGVTAGYEITTEYLDQLDGAIDAFKRLAEL
jgi:hypothetical protein